MSKNPHSLIHLSNSLRQYFGLNTYHPTDKLVDEWLETHQFSCVAVLLIDGMGYDHIKKLPSSFMNRYCVCAMDSVFPPTTAAATTSFLTGKTPWETGWVGWHQYLERQDEESLILFFNQYYQSGRKHDDPAYSYHRLSISYFQNETEQGLTLFPAWSGSGLDSFQKMCEAVASYQSDHPVIYAYWDALDNLMHQAGPDAFQVKEMMQDISSHLDWLSGQLDESTGLIVIADHGHINVSTLYFEDDPELCHFLKRYPSIEGRACSFLIKDGKHEEFRQYFNKHYGSFFHLYARQEIYDSGLLGSGDKHPLLDLIIGDFVAAATDKYILQDKNHRPMAGNHAGLTKAEREVPLILFPK